MLNKYVMFLADVKKWVYEESPVDIMYRHVLRSKKRF